MTDLRYRLLVAALLFTGCTERTAWVIVCEADCDYAKRCDEGNDRCYANCRSPDEETFSLNFANAYETCAAEQSCGAGSFASLDCAAEHVEITPYAREYCREEAKELFESGVSPDIAECERFRSVFSEEWLSRLVRCDDAPPGEEIECLLQ